MLSRLVISKGSTLCTGIFLVFLSTSLVKSQTSVSLDLSRHNTISGNNSVLNRINQEHSVSPPSISKNNERKLPDQSSIALSTEPDERHKNSTDIHELDSNNQERHFFNNKELLKTTSAYNLQATVKSPSVIHFEESTEPNKVTEKHLMRELIDGGYSMIKNDENVKIPEFNEHIDYSDIEDNDKFGNREPTTTKLLSNNEMLSLINDTNVNYKAVKKEYVDDTMIMRNVKIPHENSTNIISDKSDIHVKSKQVEINKNITGQKTIRITELNDFDEKLDENISSKIIPLIISDISNKSYESITTNNERKNERKNSLQKSRTISFSGINEFSDTQVKKNISTKENTEVEFTKEIKPYPYLKSTTVNLLNSSKVVGDSTDESSALDDNTIVKNQDAKKLVVMESSVVIDNSIQQIKPNNFKRSGNLSRISYFNDSSLSSSVTLRTRELIRDINTSITTQSSIILDKTVNIISASNDQVIDNKSNIDLSSNTEHTNLVQNSTKIKDIQKEPESSMLLVSSLNITEDSTKNPTTIRQDATTEYEYTSTTTTTIIPDEILHDITTHVSQTTSNPVTTSRAASLPPSNQLKFTNFSSPVFENESTTSVVEYEFIGLTESTVSPSSYISTSDSNKIVTNVNEFILNISNINTTISSIDSTDISIIEDLSTKINNDNITIVPMKPNDDTTTMYLITEEFISTTENPFDTTIYTTYVTETSYPDETTIIQEETTNPEFSNELKFNASSSIDSMNATTTPLTTTMKTDMVATSNTTNVTSSGPFDTTITPIGIIPVTLSTENSTSMKNTERPIKIVTDMQPFAPEDVNLLVRIIIENTWNDVCHHLSDLRQSLADLLTAGIEKSILAMQIIFQKNPCIEKLEKNIASTELTLSTLYLYVVDQNGNFDAAMTRILPNLYSSASIQSQLTIRSIQLVQDSDSGNAIAVVVVSCVAFICLVLLAGLLFIMRKRQTRFNYGERCRPVSLDAFSLDSVSAYNSVRRKGINRASKRSYGNPTFEDSTAIPSHPLNFTGLSTFCNELNTIYEEFSGIPQVSVRIDELPSGAEVKNRYANVIPLPETRVPLLQINNDPLSEYINASYVRGPRNATKYYIACQSPIESTVTDFWRMIWEQQSKVIIMLTDLIENGVEKCAEYIPPSEVTDCHRLYGDYQITLKKRETKEKYAISTLHLKNLENNTYREISHIWYLWPTTNGVQADAAGLIAVLLEARALQRGGPTPIVVHCSPGTGRTGTLIALDLGIRQYEITRTVDVPRVVYTIRRDRAGAVQTKEQYAFIYKALNLYATKLAGGGLEST